MAAALGVVGYSVATVVDNVTLPAARLLGGINTLADLAYEQRY